MDTKCRSKFVCYLIILLGLYGQVRGLYDVATAKSLYTTLTTNYTPHVRPSATVIIRIEFSVLSINTLDVKNQLFSVTGWLTVVWTDDQLKWTPSSYSSITTMFFNDATIWKPELVIENSAKSIPIIENENLYMKVDSTGIVTWDPPGVYTVNCDVDITYYPFDTQTCYIGLSTWSYDSSLLNLVQDKSSINFEDYQQNGEWDIISTRVSSSEKSDRNNAGTTRNKLEFYFTLQRKTSYYVLNILLPPMLTSFLGLMVFLLPAESGEKVGYSITVLLALAVLLTIVTTYIPTTSEKTSVFGVYLVVMLFVSSFEVVITILVLRIHHKADKDIPVPGKIQKFTHVFLSRITCFRSILRPKCCGKRGTSDSESDHVKKTQIRPKLPLESVHVNGKLGFSSVKSDGNHVVSKSDVNVTTDEKHEEDPNDDRKEYSWQEIAAMVDIAALYTLLLVMMISTAVFTDKLSNNN